MKILITLILISQLTFANDTKLEDISGLVNQVKKLQKELAEFKESQRCYKSEWIAVKNNQTSNPINHKLGIRPSKAFIWASINKNGENAQLMDGIYSVDGGYGVWIFDMNLTSYKYTTGVKAVTSIYGATSSPSLYGNKQRYIQIVLCK